MISLNRVTSALGISTPQRTSKVGIAVEKSSGPPLPQDAASLSGSAPPPPPPPPNTPTPGRMGDMGRESALQALPNEGRLARLLDSKAGPMTEQQRSACIADLETLHLAGQLKVLDLDTMEYSRCNVARALETMAEGGHLFYSGSGRQAKQLIPIQDLQKLAATAQEASLGIVG